MGGALCDGGHILINQRRNIGTSEPFLQFWVARPPHDLRASSWHPTPDNVERDVGGPCLNHPKCFSGGRSNVDDAPTHERATVIDPHGDRAAVSDICHAQVSTKRQSPMCRG